MQGSWMRMVRFNEVSNTKKKGITNARNNIGINYYVTLPCIWFIRRGSWLHASFWIEW
jgi:hypothetical protein